jgi:hypothetical protein
MMRKFSVFAMVMLATTAFSAAYSAAKAQTFSGISTETFPPSLSYAVAAADHRTTTSAQTLTVTGVSTTTFPPALAYVAGGVDRGAITMAQIQTLPGLSTASFPPSLRYGAPSSNRELAMTVTVRGDVW